MNKESFAKVPEFRKKLTGSFWGITTFFNPINYKNKIKNYKIFRKCSKMQGLKLLTVELAYGNSPFELNKDDADILIQLRTGKNNIFWQRERLLNIGLEHLPKDCDKIAWVDCDIIFANNNWVKETSDLLNKYKIIQPFSISVKVSKNKKPWEIKLDKIEFGALENQKRYSVGYKFQEKGNYNGGRPGMAWAARKEIFEDIGFYDKLILGSGDISNISAFCNHKEIISHFPEKILDDMKSWKDEIYKRVRKSISYTPGILFHLWHGDVKDRKYKERHLLLKKYSFNPKEDIKKNEDGVLVWASDKPKMHQAIKKYSKRRKEEGNALLRWLC